MKTFASYAVLAICLCASSTGVVHAADRADVASDQAAASAPLILPLIDGWYGGPFSTNQPSVQLTGNIVSLRGAIGTAGSSTHPFVLPKAYRPKTAVYVPVDMCGGTNGRLVIDTTGQVTVQAQTDFSNAQCFTSLDGASFVRSPTNYQSLTLLNGWTNAPFGTSDAAVRVIAGVVQFKGAIATSGTNSQAFVLPPAARPSVNVYVPVDLCNANSGRLVITPDGSVFVQAATDFTEAQCFSSLEGASFALNAARKLIVRNGWTGAPFGTAAPGVENKNGVVHFRGAIATSGTNSRPFILPVEYRPSKNTYVKVDMCNATNGRLILTRTGKVSVEAESDFANAQCFTSLDGASFVQ